MSTHHLFKRNNVTISLYAYLSGSKIALITHLETIRMGQLSPGTHAIGYSSFLCGS